MQTILVNCTAQIMTCEHTDIVYFTLETGNFEFQILERSYGILGKPSVLSCTICVTITEH